MLTTAHLQAIDNARLAPGQTHFDIPYDQEGIVLGFPDDLRQRSLTLCGDHYYLEWTMTGVGFEVKPEFRWEGWQPIQKVMYITFCEIETEEEYTEAYFADLGPEVCVWELTQIVVDRSGLR